MAIVNIKQLKRIEIKDFETENDFVFNFFNNLSATERDVKLLCAIYISVSQINF